MGKGYCSSDDITIQQRICEEKIITAAKTIHQTVARFEYLAHPFVASKPV
jgi:hypothetical protein